MIVQPLKFRKPVSIPRTILNGVLLMVAGIKQEVTAESQLEKLIGLLFVIGLHLLVSFELE